MRETEQQIQKPVKSKHIVREAGPTLRTEYEVNEKQANWERVVSKIQRSNSRALERNQIRCEKETTTLCLIGCVVIIRLSSRTIQ